MKPIYCTESQDRIHLEDFKSGRAIWSGGKPYLKESAKRLKLNPDLAPPPEYAAALGYVAPKAPPVVEKPVALVKPAVPPKPVVPTKPIEAPKAPQAAAPAPHNNFDKATVTAFPAPVAVQPKRSNTPNVVPVRTEPPKLVVPGKNRDEAFLATTDAAPAAKRDALPAELKRPEPKPPETKPFAPPTVPNTLPPTASPTAKADGPKKEDAKPGGSNISQSAMMERAVIVPPRRTAAWIKPGDSVDDSSDDQPTIVGMKLHNPVEASKPVQPQPLNPNASLQQDALKAAAAKAAAEAKQNADAKKAAATAEAKPAQPVPAAVPNQPANAHIALEKTIRDAEPVAAVQAPAIEAHKPVAVSKPVEAPVQPEPSKPPLEAKLSLPLPGVPASAPAQKPAVISAAQPVPTVTMMPATQPMPPVAVTPQAAAVVQAPAPAVKLAPEPAAKAPPVPAEKPAAAPVAKPVAPAAPIAKPTEEEEIAIPLQPGEPLSVEEMKKLEILEGIPEALIKKTLYGGIVRREFKKGDLICRQGEYASTAFYILSGKVEAYTVTPDKAAQAQLKKASRIEGLSLIERFRFWIEGRKDGPRKSKSRQRPAVENVQVLPPHLRHAEMGPGDLFGEMSCINFYPRNANIRATEDCVVVELIRTVLDAVRTRKSKYKEKLDRNYRERALAEHLNAIPLFKGLDPEFINQLRKLVELKDYEPGEVIFNQGDASDAFYLVRRGCVKVSQAQPGGELVLTYLGQHDSFGEIGLLRNVKRTATCTALDHVEVVRIAKKHFDFLTQCYDEFKTRMNSDASERLAQSDDIAQRPPSRPLGEFIDHELMQAQNVLLIDLEKCTRCDECVKACVDSHDNNKSRLMREGLRFDKYLLATSCRSCMDPVCMIGCPVGSIRREATFEIIIEDWCIGCEKCAKQCPYGNITMHEFPKSKEELARDIAKEEEAQRKKASSAKPATPEGKHEAKAELKNAPGDAHKDTPVSKVATLKKVAVTCDQCSTLQEPSCVYACPHEAAMRVNARDFFEIVGKSTLKEAPKSEKTP